MKLVLTNDDGIDAPGLKAFEQVIRGFGSVIVVAPESPNSGIGHKVTTKAPIKVERAGKSRFRITGTPADCSRIALTQIAPDADWLFAGINQGGNLGADIYMSGTVAAAREAALLGFRAVAVSHYVAKNRQIDWDLARLRVKSLICRLISERLQPGCFLNVNLPHPADDETDLPVVFCSLDTNPHGVHYYKDGNQLIYDGDYHSRPRQPGRDVDVCFSGQIAVTQIPLELGNHNTKPAEGQLNP
ncbi:MAG: 5'/3'-nucleotidase SurE [Deltaproteobacteria bacterium]|nr:5'/3'-nucleotidase SurE [Deltaproteobacteria bacterium]MBW1960502.1 5'/3'-nucleotidase SurE [Deltaproteobacteria bacterium]MBW1993155.1 5'/3'-nucleotidase SurE [Deltaproteobacteria bacterium]MBW2150752.1 5'/3'-nucleotidase SurE [Deltaproteobacteria bacterium]